MPRAILIATMLLGLLGACQPLSHPFQPDFKGPGENPLLTPAADASLFVAPLTGVTQSISDPISEGTAAELRGRDIPASTKSASRGTYIAAGEVSSGMLRWRLINPNGLTRATSGALPMPAAPSPAALSQIVTQSATVIELLVRGDTRRLEEVSGPVMAIHGVTGAPGDGDTALARAMTAILTRQKVKLGDMDSPDALVLVGSVRMSDAPRKDEQVIEIVWELLRPDGSSVGRVGQQNNIPRGMLDNIWGDTAYAAAQGGADGVMSLLQQAAKETAQPAEKAAGGS